MLDEIEIAITRCSACGWLPRVAKMGVMVCDRCGGIEVPQSSLNVTPKPGVNINE